MHGGLHPLCFIATSQQTSMLFKSLFPSLFLLFLFGNFNQVLACSPQNKYLPTICEMYGKASGIFVGRVVALERNNNEDNGKDDVAYFHVQEAFLGVKTGDKRVKVVLGGAGIKYCGLVEGESFLVYTHRNLTTKEFSMDGGTRTQRVSEAAEDLTFLRNPASRKSGIELYGKVMQYVKSSLEPDNKQPVAGYFVKAERLIDYEKIDPKTKPFRTKTKSDGGFKLTNLPAGRYKVSLDLNDKYLNSSDITTMIINDKGCVLIDGLRVSSKSKITGKVVDAEGEPVDNVVVEVISLNVQNPDGWGEEFTQTSSDGTFRVYSVPPGLYTISVNYSIPPDDESPFSPVFYPGVSTRSQAEMIKVELGEDVTDIEFRLPQKLRKQSIGGKVLWADGTPAAGVKVYLKDHLHDVCCVNELNAKTDEQGRFTIHGFDKRKYRVWAVGKRFADLEQQDYGISPPFVLNAETPHFVLILNKTESWLTDMDADNEAEKEEKPFP
jgi:hypothetical protein